MSTPFQRVAPPNETLLARIAELESSLQAERAIVEKLTAERDQLRASHERLRQELKLFRRRIFVAQAERVDTAQLELEFAGKMAELTKIEQQLDKQLAEEAAAAANDASDADGKGSRSKAKAKAKAKPKGRRDLEAANLPTERVELSDPVLDALVARGEAARIGFEESSRLGWRRGGFVRLVMARAKYSIKGQTPETTEIATTPLPAEPFRRSMAAPSLLAHIIVDKFADGLPLNRIQNRFTRDGVPVDRGTMCRWLEDAGATFGATVIAMARQEAFRTAFCIATDATGIRVQPGLSPDKKRRPCRKGNFFVLLADRDHAFFEYTPRETSAVVAEMFKGFSGFVQADAKAVFDVLFIDSEKRRQRLRRKTSGEDPDVDDRTRHEVACWCHCRRGFWEAAITKNAVGREGLVRIGRIFALEERWADRSPDKILELRQKHAQPHVESFFAWAEIENEKLGGVRSLLSRALGYALRHKAALMRYLDDGRLVLDNNRSERALRSIATGRKGWLFIGSDDHGVAAGHLLSGVASCRLHGLDPEAYSATSSGFSPTGRGIATSSSRPSTGPRPGPAWSPGSWTPSSDPSRSLCRSRFRNSRRLRSPLAGVIVTNPVCPIRTRLGIRGRCSGYAPGDRAPGEAMLQLESNNLT